MTVHRRSVLAMGAGGFLATVPGALRAAMPVIPGQACTLSRTLDRILIDGALIRVERQWQVRFSEQDGGYIVEGEQSFVAVDAPPALQPLAKLEASRTESSLFPIRLDTAGLIASTDSGLIAAPMADLLGAAEKFIANAAGGPDRKAQARAFANSLDMHAAKMLSRLPHDLFFPRELSWLESRDVALPDGPVGHVSIQFDAQKDPRSGLLRSAERTVVTTLDEASRTSREIWKLSV
ncbi:hypothetical protein OAS19_05525 [Altererythrobacter sp.]|nr:hypothetical protein [Altererythrobacter sp.]